MLVAPIASTLVDNILHLSRTLRYKAITVVGITIGILGYTLMAVRWLYISNVWESLYYVGAGFSLWITLNAQFVGLTVAAPEDQKALR